MMHPKALIEMHVAGQSMQPTLRQGESVLVNTAVSENQLKLGDILVIGRVVHRFVERGLLGLTLSKFLGGIWHRGDVANAQASWSVQSAFIGQVIAVFRDERWQVLVSEKELAQQKVTLPQELQLNYGLTTKGTAYFLSGQGVRIKKVSCNERFWWIFKKLKRSMFVALNE